MIFIDHTGIIINKRIKHLCIIRNGLMVSADIHYGLEDDIIKRRSGPVFKHHIKDICKTNEK